MSGPQRSVAALLLLQALALAAGCFNFDSDLSTCREPEHACARGQAAIDDGGAQDAGSDGGALPPSAYCEAAVECASGLCTDSCCDSSCSGVVDIVAGYSSSCAVVTDGTVRCWGDNAKGGVLGEKSDAGSVLIPTTVRGISGARRVVAGIDFACALLDDATVSCWGRGAEGELGRGATDGGPQPPSPVTGLSGVTALAAGGAHVCALLASGQVRCWGYNFHGQLGDGTAVDRDTPVPVCNSGTSQSGCLPLTGAVEISAGGESTCARVSVGTGRFAARCWGSNASYQFGAESPFSTNSPMTVPGLPDNLSSLRVGPSNGCAIVSGQLWCWGANATSNDEWVMLGRGPDAGLSTPDAGAVCAAFDAGGCVPLLGVSQVGMGDDFGCALVGDAVRCWGADYLDRLGTQTQASADVAVPADRGSVELGGTKLLQSKVVSLSVGAAHACARLQGGSAVCWGADVYGQLGNNDDRQFNAATGPSRPIW